MAQRMYGLFEKVDGRWVRIRPSLSFPKSTAVLVFQDSLLRQALVGDCGERCLRPVERQS
jgi:hypothetical protein